MNTKMIGSGCCQRGILLQQLRSYLDRFFSLLPCIRTSSPSAALRPFADSSPSSILLSPMLETDTKTRVPPFEGSSECIQDSGRQASYLRTWLCGWRSGVALYQASSRKGVRDQISPQVCGSVLDTESAQPGDGMVAATYRMESAPGVPCLCPQASCDLRGWAPLSAPSLKGGIS